ncbi:MAG: radical SAM protein [Deltaproteobacteria bacterium]|nr:radical SAM protein [Deltaproteobacteria bacterium]
MHYEGNIIRPPSEANSILLQVTLGCSHNKCTFCGTYKDKRFGIKPDSIIDEDIAFAAKYCKNQRRVFICDGDALIIPMKRLVRILEKIKNDLPQVTRIGLYGNAKGLKMKTVKELEQLKELGLKIIYMGLESGDEVTLKAINKGATPATMIETGRKARNAGIKLSVTVLLGIAGNIRSQIHAKQTGKVLSAIEPNYIGALSLMLLPDTSLYKDWEKGEFQLIEPNEMLAELRTMIAWTDISSGLFHANHASNYLPIKARLPKDKEPILKIIDDALAGKVELKPEWLRAL